MTSASSNPLGTFEDPVAGGLTGIVLDVAKKVGGAFFEAVKDKRQAKAALERYEAKYRQRYGSVRILGMKQDYPLEQVYTKVKFLDDLSIRRFESLEAVEDDYRGRGTRQFNTRERIPQDGTNVVNAHPRLTVLGQPGAGKSTFLRRLGLAAFKNPIENPFDFQCIPVFLELKRFNPTNANLLGAVAKELSNFSFPETPEFAAKVLEQGKLLILLDGLDEVPRDILNPAIEAIQDFVTRYDQNRFVTSCRTAVHRSDFLGFTNVELADFDDEQIKNFIEHWFQSPSDQESHTAKRCWEQLNDERNRAARELAQTPLLLTFLCLVYNRTQKFFDKRATLYRKALDILLEEWAAEKRLAMGDVHEGLNTELEKILLSEIAYNGFVNDQLFFTRQELIDQINGFIEDTADRPTLPGKVILNAIAEQQGIFVERAEDIYSFSHLTLQEYLTAQYVYQNPQLISDTVKDHIFDDRWREVFLLVPGLLRNADSYLLKLQTFAQNCLNTPKLKEIIIWSDKVTKCSTGTYKPAVKRAAAIFLALALDSAIDIALALACAHALDLIRVLDSDGAVDLNLRLNIVSTLARGNARACDSALVHALTQYSIIACDINISSTQIEEFAQLGILEDINFSMFIFQLKTLREQTPDSKDPFVGSRQEFLDKKIGSIWLQTLKLNPEVVKLSRNEVDNLTRYLYINRLILECKDSALRVSKNTWDNLQSRMLTLWKV